MLHDLQRPGALATSGDGKRGPGPERGILRAARALRREPALLLVLVLASCAPRAVQGPPAVVPPEPPPEEAAEAPPATPPPVAAEEPAPAPPPEPRPRPTIPARLRVGLATDLEELRVPCCHSALVASARGEELAVVETLRIEPAPRAARPGFFRVQVAALKDEGQARDLAAELERLVGEPAAVVFDAGADLYRVRVGRYASRDEARAAERRLALHNLHDTWIAGEQGELEEPAFRLHQGDRQMLSPGRWLTIESRSGGGDDGDGEGDAGVPVLGKRYRGRILLYLNDRGTLNVINEVTLEDYLRGVVPREMGPAIYDHLEALKAQAVAARTYTLRNLGEFAGEGYDICATPRCQVYGGMDVEHELSDRAVLETAGEFLLYRGELADALYSSTCGGHTEDVDVVFPLKQAPYLRGVPCFEQGFDRLEGAAVPGLKVEEWLAREVAPAGRSGAAAQGARFERLAALAGLATPPDELRSLDRREVQRFIASQFDLAVDARLFLAHEDIDYLLDHPPGRWSDDELRLAAYLRGAGLLEGPLDGSMAPGEIDATLFHLALFLRVLERREARYEGLDGRRLRLRGDEEAEIVELPERLGTFRRRGGPALAAPLKLVPGDRLTLFLQGGAPLAVEQQVDPEGVGYDRTSDLATWTRFRSDARLAELVAERFPGFQFTGLEIGERGVSGRVRELRLSGAGGRTEVVRGLPIRWTLALPDTLFTARRLRPADGPPGWLFKGRGWGHGVGLCQVGAYGMALRGHGYRGILEHYYTGVELVRLEPEE